MSVFDEFQHTITSKDIPMLKNDLEFEVHLSSTKGERSYLPPMKIEFLCQEITQDERNPEVLNVPAASIPCLFSCLLPEEDFKQSPGILEFNFGNTINKKVNNFFQSIISCKTSLEADLLFGTYKIHIEKIKSLTNVYERKVLIEKHYA